MTIITSVNILNITHNIKIFHNISAEVCKIEKTGIFNSSFFVKKVILKFISIILVLPTGKGRRDYTLVKDLNIKFLTQNLTQSVSDINSYYVCI